MIAQHGNMPNLIITGPPGTGKTTSVMALARELLADQFENAVLEMNASDARCVHLLLRLLCVLCACCMRCVCCTCWCVRSLAAALLLAACDDFRPCVSLCSGIDIVRNKIKMFAQKKVTLAKGRHKIIILDEADRCAPPNVSQSASSPASGV